MELSRMFVKACFIVQIAFHVGTCDEEPKCFSRYDYDKNAVKDIVSLEMKVARLEQLLADNTAKTVRQSTDDNTSSNVMTQAQAFCASRVSKPDWVFALYRGCTPDTPTCEDLCTNAREQILASIGNARNKVSCFDAIHVGNAASKLNGENSYALGYRSYSYGDGGCTWRAGHCGPTHCCCRAHF